MRKDIFYFGISIAFIALLSSGFKTYENENLDFFYNYETHNGNYTIPSKDAFQNSIQIPYVGKSFIGFKQALAKRESQGRYDLVNSYGYMGKYQFGKTALRVIGVTNNKEFLKNPELQEKAILAFMQRNKHELRREIRKYAGKRINGILITESGMLAAAHLAGAGSVKSFLRSNGQIAFKDGYGTCISSYLKKFKNYDTSYIVADKNAKV